MGMMQLNPRRNMIQIVIPSNYTHCTARPPIHLAWPHASPENKTFNEVHHDHPGYRVMNSKNHIATLMDGRDNHITILMDDHDNSPKVPYRGSYQQYTSSGYSRWVFCHSYHGADMQII